MNIFSEAPAITPSRYLNNLYIIIDIIFLIAFLGILIWKKRYLTVLFGLMGGVIYTIVDYVGFYLMSHSREIYINDVLCDNWQTFLILLWMSMSYGITNFIFMWTLVSKDKYAPYFVFLIVTWWLIAPSIAEMGGESTIMTYRTTGAYHGWMGVVLIVGYFILAIAFMRENKPWKEILRLFLIGFFVQFGWEFALLINGIRPMNAASIRTLLVNSCLETNLGIPIIYLIYHTVSKYFNEDLSKNSVEEQEAIKAIG